MVRVFYKDSEGEWWLDTSLMGEGSNLCPERVRSLSDLPPPIHEYLTMLSLAEEGQTIAGVGKRISRDTFWVFV